MAPWRPNFTNQRLWLYQSFCNPFVFENYFQVVVNIFKGHLQWLERTTLLANGLCCIMCQKLWRLVSISASRGAEVSYTASWLELWWHNWPAWLRALSLQWIEKISEHFLIYLKGGLFATMQKLTWILSKWRCFSWFGQMSAEKKHQKLSSCDVIKVLLISWGF